MKLYVWEGVLRDYTDGLVCVLAHTEKEAWELLYKKDSTAYFVLQGECRIDRGEYNSYSTAIHEELIKEKRYYTDAATRPKEITIPEAFVVWGGG